MNKQKAVLFVDVSGSMPDGLAKCLMPTAKRLLTGFSVYRKEFSFKIVKKAKRR